MRRLLFIFAVLAAFPAAATTYYVDGSPTGCSGSPCSNSNNGTSTSTAWLTVDKCITKPLVAGDTCTIRAGTYAKAAVANIGGFPAPTYDLNGLNGSAGNVITFTNYPAETAILCEGTGGACNSSLPRDVIGIHEGGSASYVTISGLTIQGSVWFRGSTSHLTIHGNDIHDGGGNCTGNQAIVRLEFSSFPQVDHNHIHDYVPSSSCSGTPGTLWLEFVVDHETFEYNTLDQVVAGNANISVHMKDCPKVNVYRYNDIGVVDMEGPFQSSGLCGGVNGHDIDIYGNVLRNATWGKNRKDTDDLRFHNNTIIGGSIYFSSDSEPDSPPRAATHVQVYNNIIQSPPQEGACLQASGCNVVIEFNPWAVGLPTSTWDFNRYNSAADYEGDRQYPTSSSTPGVPDGGTQYNATFLGPGAGSWQAALATGGSLLNGNGVGRDLHSTEAATPCTFTAGADTPYHVTTATTCKTGACANWPTCSSTTGEYGAYDATVNPGGCVGWTCGAMADTTPPVLSGGSPTGVLSANTTSTNLQASTDEAATCKYGTSDVAYASLPNTFTTTGGTSHSSVISGLTNGNSYTYYVRCVDGSSNVDTSGYQIAFSVPVPPVTSFSCASPPAGMIFCDDFEAGTSLASRYTEYEPDDDTPGDDATARFKLVTTEAHSGTHSMETRYVTAHQSSGHLWYNFGRNPASSMTQSSTDFPEIYWRFWIKLPVGFQGHPGKLSRARVLALSDYTDAATGHLWDGQTANLNLGLDPANGVCGPNSGGTCLTSDSTVATSGYNDFNNYWWLGLVQGASHIYDSAHQGTWHCIEAHMKLNTPGSADGLMEEWVDGTLDAQATGLNFRGNYSTYAINHWAFEGYWNVQPPVTQYRYVDDIAISTNRIGCGAPANPGIPQVSGVTMNGVKKQ